MKQKLLNKLWLRVGMIVAIMTTALTASAAEEVYSTCLFGSTYNSKGVSGYTNVNFTATNGDFSWTVANANNNNNGWSFIKIGGKNGAYTGTITTNAAYSEAITKVVVTIDAITASNVTSIKLYTSSNNSTWTEAGSFTKATGAQTVTLSSPAANLYYKIEFVCTKGSSNGLVSVSKVEYYYNAGGNPIVATPTFSLAEGTYTSAQNVTISTTTTGATIYYTTDGNEPTTSSSVYSSAIPVSSTTTIKAIAVADGYDNSSVATATYTILSIEHAGTEADPYTVADARAAIDAGVGVESVYATGIVSQIVTAYNSQYGNISYNISTDGTTTSDQLEVFRGKGIDGADFTSADDIQVGDVVVVKGNLTKYNSTYEFAEGNQLVSLDRPVTPSITASNVNIEYNATSGSIEFSINNEVQDGVLTADITAGNEGSWLSLGTVTTSVALTCSTNEGNADRTATVTLTYTYDTNKTVTKDVTVTQTHFVADYATLPFSFNDGKAAIENTAGLTETGLGSDYNSSPKLKFDSTGDELILKINERPGKLTFDIKGNTFSGGTFKVQTSEDGTTYTDLKTYTELGDTQDESFTNLDANVRYIKWVYTNKSSGNVALGNIALAAYVAPANYNLTVTLDDNISAIYIYDAADQTEALIEDGAAGTVQVTNGTEILVSPDVAAGYQLASLMVDGVDVTSQIDETGAYTFTMPTHAVAITATAEEYVAPSGDQYALYSGDLVEGDYIVVYEGKAMNTTVTSDRLQYAEVTSANNVITTDNAAIVWHIAPSGDYWTIYNAAANAYAASTGAKNKAQMLADGTDDKALWTVSGTETYEFVNKGNTANEVNANLRKNGTYGFACYATSTGGALSLYKKVVPTESVKLNASGYATFSSNNAVSIPADGDFTAWKITNIGNDNKITFVQVTGNVKAGTGLFLKGDAKDEITIEVAASGEELSGNKLVGFPTATNVADNEYYGLSGNQFVKVTAGTVKAGKALLPAGYITDSNSVKPFTFVFEDDATGIEETLSNSHLKGENIYNLAGQMVNGKSVNGKLPKGIYIVNGKKILK